MKQQRKKENFNIKNAIEYAKDKSDAYDFDNSSDEINLEDKKENNKSETETSQSIFAINKNDNKIPT